jgi:hypothetical protein
MRDARQLWFFWGESERAGPFSGDEVREMIVNGHLQPNQVVWQKIGDTHLYVRADKAAERGEAVAEAQEINS